MTRDQHIELCDALTAVNIILERTDHLTQAMLEDFFNKYDPDDDKDAFSIRYVFPRMRVFASLLRDQLIAIESKLPAEEWADNLKCEEETT